MYRKNFLSKRHRLLADINVTPLVDVVLVLLIIFMIASPMLDSGFNVNVPQVKSGRLNNQSQNKILFTIDSHGVVRLEQKIVSMKQIKSKLHKYNTKITQVFIKGDQASSYGSVALLLSIVKNSGFENISLITRNPN